MYYFVRVNGNTIHNNPNDPDRYIPGEPPRYPNTYFNALKYCLQNNFARIGWPATGDLNDALKQDVLTAPYSSKEFTDNHRKYLRSFFNIQKGSVILIPDKDHSGDIYLGKVIKTYHYFNDVPVASYEHSHRLGVEWLRDTEGNPKCFKASALNISNIGGFWTRAFHALENSPTGQAAIPFIAKYLTAD
ncbi:hypothetical protein IAD21_02023 [Abditibacteriota bacterium]|nr:hypothetical protein IAD21_02023 [Abditibacteriota bacterium]